MLGLDYQVDINWQRDGLKLSEKIRNVYQFYPETKDTNKINQIVKIGETCIGVTDQIGTLRLF